MSHLGCFGTLSYGERFFAQTEVIERVMITRSRIGGRNDYLTLMTIKSRGYLLMTRFRGVSGFVGAACITLTAWPPMKTVAERAVAVVFAAIV